MQSILYQRLVIHMVVHLVDPVCSQQQPKLQPHHNYADSSLQPCTFRFDQLEYLLETTQTNRSQLSSEYFHFLSAHGPSICNQCTLYTILKEKIRKKFNQFTKTRYNLLIYTNRLHKVARVYFFLLLQNNAQYHSFDYLLFRKRLQPNSMTINKNNHQTISRLIGNLNEEIHQNIHRINST